MRCETCGNDYDKALTVTDADGNAHTYDTFQCAIQALAPTCARCGTKVIGQGIEDEDSDAIYCGRHCAGAPGA